MTFMKDTINSLMSQNFFSIYNSKMPNYCSINHLVSEEKIFDFNKEYEKSNCLYLMNRY
jgi:hypothetical protein